MNCKQEQYIKRNIEVFMRETKNKELEFGASYIQRICKISYIQSRYTIDAMLEHELIKVSEKYNYRYVNKGVNNGL